MDWINYQIENNQVEYKICNDVLDWNNFIGNSRSGNIGCLNIFHLNIRSLKKYWDELQLKISESIFDIIFLSEVDVSEAEVEFFHLENYKKVFKLRKYSSGGGLIMFYRDYLYFYNKPNSFTSCECIIGSIKEMQSGLELNIVFIYRPPGLGKLDFINDARLLLEGCKDFRLLWVGDVNFDLLDRDSAIVKEYEVLLYGHGLNSVIQSATREEIRDGVLTSSLIDHIFLRSNSNKILSGVIHTKIADHYPVVVLHSEFVDRINRQNDANFPTVELVRTVDNKKVNELITDFDWTVCYNFHDVHKFSLNICNNLNLIYSKSKIEYVKKTRDNLSSLTRYKNWMTYELLVKIKEKDRLFKKWKSNPNNQKYKVIYTKVRNKLNNEIRRAKERYFKKNFEENISNTKKLWFEVNRVLRRKVDRDVDKKIVHAFGCNSNNSLREITSNFARVFISQINDIMVKNVSSRSYVINDNGNVCNANVNFYLPYTTSGSILKLIENEVSVNKSPGFDNIRAKDILCNKNIFSNLLSDLFNQCIRKGVFPDNLKISVIRPLFKKGDASNYCNYRPISILSVVEKVFEKYIVRYLKDYFCSNNIINKNQYGFQKGKGTEKLIIEINDYLNIQLNKGYGVLAIFIDFSRAFDTVNHGTLINRLQEIGVSGTYLNLFKSYLDNRKFVVKVDSSISNLNSVDFGVPQGSCLGPLFFILYVNNIFNVVNKCKLYMYADDVVLLFSHRDIETCRRILQDELNLVVKWSLENNMYINGEKTKVMYFRTPHMVRKNFNEVILHKYSCIQIGMRDVCNCERLNMVSDCNYLGVIFDENLKFDKHVEVVFNKLKKILCCMYALKPYVNSKVLKIVYKSLFESVLRYGVQVWGGTGLVHLSKLTNLQFKVLKIIAQGQNLTNSELLEVCDTLTPNGFYKLYHLVNNFGDSSYKQLVHYRYAIRRQKYIVPRTFNNYGEKSLKCLIPKLYNSLPERIKSLKNFKEFKNEVKSWLQANL